MTQSDSRRPIVTFFGASRAKDNPNHRMEGFLSSVVSHTRDLSRVEAVVRVDADDDLLHFDDLRRRFPFFRYVIGDRENGYRDLHKMVTAAWVAASPSSEFAFGFADDFVICRRDWDEEIAHCVTVNRASRAPIILFIALRGRERPFLDYQTLLSHTRAMGPETLLPIVHRSVLDAAAAVAGEFDGWTPFGNSLLCDSFFEFLRFHLWRQTGRDWTVRLPPFFSQLDEVAPAAHKGYQRWAKSIFMETWPALIAPDSQTVISRIAQEIMMRNDLLLAYASRRHQRDAVGDGAREPITPLA
jgi:hypothetical protein